MGCKSQLIGPGRGFSLYFSLLLPRRLVRIALRRQPVDPVEFFRFSNLDSVDHFDGHFGDSVPVLASAVAPA